MAKKKYNTSLDNINPKSWMWAPYEPYKPQQYRTYQHEQEIFCFSDGEDEDVDILIEKLKNATSEHGVKKVKFNSGAYEYSNVHISIISEENTEDPRYATKMKRYQEEKSEYDKELEIYKEWEKQRKAYDEELQIKKLKKKVEELRKKGVEI